LINNNAKRFLELLNITQHIQYNNPSKDNCPVCGEYNSLFLLHNLQGIWACCTECKTRGMENDWLELLENDKPINNFYSHTWNMLSKYGDRMYKENLDEAQKDILVRMGCEPGKKSDFPYIGVTTVGEFNVDLAMASRAEGGVEIKRQGHKFLKQDRGQT